MTPPIRRVLAPNPSHMTLQGTNTYLIGRSELAVIDPGPEMEEHLEAILAECGSASIRAILVTHRHSDHLPAALPLSGQTGAPVYGHAELPNVQRVLADGDRVVVEDFELRAIATPGHTREHLCYLLEGAGILFSGDHIIGSGSVVVGSGAGDLASYLASLRRLQTLELERVLPGHGPAVEDPTAKIAEYIEHRLLRERQIVGELAKGARAIGEIRAAIYLEVPDKLIWAAENNIRTHLLKLSEEGRAVEANGTWSLRSI